MLVNAVEYDRWSNTVSCVRGAILRTYPHHLTTDLPVLPVPDLAESLERYRKSSAAVLDAEAEADMNQAIADFAIGPAPALQQTLEQYAETMAESGSNWMAEQWLEQYLRVRQPLLLASNVTFQLNLVTVSTGVERVVELLQRIGAIHILQAKRQTPQEYNARGQRVSMDGWADFNGGIRTPGVEEDLWMRAGTGATYRTIGLLHLGRMWEVPFTGSEGKLLDANQLRESVQYVLSQTRPAKQSFAGFSAMGSETLSRDTVWQTDKNRSTYDRLANMLFTMTLDANAEDDIQTLARWAFHPGNTWAYKPISYQVSLGTQMLAATVEHSVIDGGTLHAAVARMQQVHLETLDSQTDTQVGKPKELVWDNLAYDLTQYHARAESICAERVLVRRDQQLPYAMSPDTLAQLILMIAQQLTYGHIRAHYQSCDMRHFRAGRTEAVRPVTLEAVHFVTNLLANRATEAQFKAALSAHRQWVIAAKNGEGFDRHFFMLRHIGQELGGANAAIFTEHTDAVDDFVSTSSLGGPETIIRYIYAPTVEGGFGVNYTTLPNRTEFLVTWVTGTPHAEAFHRNLQPAAELLYDFIATLEPIT